MNAWRWSALSLAVGGLIPAGCGRGGRPADRGQAARDVTPFVAPAETNLIRGIYERERRTASFRPCGSAREYLVSAPDTVYDLLDGNVDWHAPRPSTKIFVQVMGDTTAAGRDTKRAGTLAVVSLDSSRQLESGECTPPRPDTPPPPAPAVVAATLRTALGKDSAEAKPGTFTGAAVWLNGDQRGDLVILAKAPALCTLRGCTLFAFEGTPNGYRLVGRTQSVVAPIVVRPEKLEGWQMLHVKVNGGVFGLRDAVLRWHLRGYPEDASFEAGLAGRRFAMEQGLGITVIR